MKFDVTVKRVTKYKLNEEKMKSQLQFIAQAANRNAANNWKISIPKRLVTAVEINGLNHYTAVIQLERDRFNDETAVRRRFAKCVVVMGRAARQQKWELVGEEALAMNASGQLVCVNGAGESTEDPAPALTKLKPSPKISPFLAGEPLPPLSEDVFSRYFSRIYNRESHIRVIYDHLSLAVKTNFKTRHHILLKGKPSCAKTELFLAFTDWLGEDFIESIDASTMTKAGLERFLLSKAEEGTLKPILIMEEIEKTAGENVSCLIQVMDARGKIQRTNANTVRDGQGAASCPIIIWGTCNDEEALEEFHKGALYSRFSNKLDCARPDRTLMERILLREVNDIGGRKEWVPAVLSFCYDEIAYHPKFKKYYDDPRFARSLLAGGDRLLERGENNFLDDFRKACGIGHPDTR